MAKIFKKLSMILAVVASSVSGVSFGSPQLTLDNTIRYADGAISSSAHVATDGLYLATDNVCNGDFIKLGYGCLTGELVDNGIDIGKYHDGLYSSSELITLGENGSNVYLYVYTADRDIAYDRTDISTSTTLDSESADLSYIEAYKRYSLDVVSTSSDRYLKKYLVKGLAGSADGPHRYSVRNIYNFENASNSNYYINGAQEFYFTNENGYSMIQPVAQKTITITSKQVGFQIIGRDLDDNPLQRFHILFDTNIDIEKIYKASISYEYKTYTCNTIHDINDHKTTDFKGMSECYNGYDGVGEVQLVPSYRETETIHVENKIITPTKREWKYNSYLLWPKKSVWNDISLVSELKQTKDFVFDDGSTLMNYKWGLFFHNHQMEFNLRTNNIIHLNPTWVEIKVADSLWANADLTKGGADYVDNVSIMQLWYQDDGVKTSAVVADTYVDADRNQAITIGTTDYNRLIKGIVLIVVIALLILCAPVLFSLISGGVNAIASLPMLFRAIFKLIALPFKLCKWLLTRPQSKTHITSSSLLDEKR